MKKNTLVSRLGWIVTALFGVGAFVMAYYAFLMTEEKDVTQLTALYRAFQIFTFSQYADKPDSIWLELARWLGPIVLGITSIRGFMFLLRDRMTSLRIRFTKGHVVICGLGVIGSTIASTALADGKQPVVIEIDEKEDQISTYRELGIPVVVGNASDPLVLQAVGALRSQAVLAMTDDDLANFQIAERLSAMHEATRSRNDLSCFARVSDYHLLSLARRLPLFSESRNGYRAQLFNASETGARVLLKTHSPELYINHDSLGSSSVLVVGFGQFGEALVCQLARIVHFDETRTFRIVVVDDEARERGEDFKERYPGLEAFVDIDFFDKSPLRLNETALTKIGMERNIGIAYFCLDDETLLGSVLDKTAAYFTTHAIMSIVAIWPKSDLGRMVSAALLSGPKRKFFTVVDESCSLTAILDAKVDTLARLIHENYRNSEIKKALEEKREAQLSARGLQPWDALREDFRSANRAQIDHHFIKLRLLGLDATSKKDTRPSVSFTPSKMELDRLARIEHKRWCTDRILCGWKLGPRNDEDRLHPSIKAWEELSDAEKMKDIDTIVNLENVLRGAGFKIVEATVAKC